MLHQLISKYLVIKQVDIFAKKNNDISNISCPCNLKDL